jgi:hypothetical protein
MKLKFSFSLIVLILSVPSMVALAQNTKQKDKGLSREQMEKLDRTASIRAPSGPNFYIGPIAETPGRFSLVLTDAGGRFVSESFGQSQLDVFEAIMVEAKKFAQTDEAVGTKKPLTTQFYDKREKAFFVDVTKLGNRSRFFITIESLTDRLTVEAGEIKRGEDKDVPFFYVILTRIQAAKTAWQTPK